jgi:hypothetical protein
MSWSTKKEWQLKTYTNSRSKLFRTRSVAQVVECLPSKHKTLSSNTSTTHKKRKTKQKQKQNFPAALSKMSLFNKYISHLLFSVILGSLSRLLYMYTYIHICIYIHIYIITSLKLHIKILKNCHYHQSYFRSWGKVVKYLAQGHTKLGLAELEFKSKHTDTSLCF